MRHKLWLLPAFALAATLSLGVTAAQAKKTTENQTAITKMTLEADAAFFANRKSCKDPVQEPARKWGWKTSRLTAEFVQSKDGTYESTILPGGLNVDEKVPLASITKLMTALVVLDAIERGKLSPHQMIKVSQESLCLGDSKFAVYGLPKNIREISVANALTHTLKLSSNPMALNLAIAVAGSEAAFVELMNAKAKEWGMKNTRFNNPHGIPEGDRKSEYTTANDMLIMSQHILERFNIFKAYSHAALKPWIIREKQPPEKQQLTALGAVFKTGTIHECSSLLTVMEFGKGRIVDIELCGGKQERFQHAMSALKSGLKRLGNMIVPPVMVESTTASIPVAVSSPQALPSSP